MVGGGDARPPRVTICIKTGSNGKGCRGLEGIQNKIAEVDVNLNWMQVFLKQYNVKVDPLRYSVRAATPGSPKHNLAEPIRIWMGGVKRVQKKYVVYVVENAKVNLDGPGTASPPSNVIRSSNKTTTAKNAGSSRGATAFNKPAAATSKTKKPSEAGDKRTNVKGKIKFPKRVKREPSPAVSSADSSRTAPVPRRKDATPSASPIRPVAAGSGNNRIHASPAGSAGRKRPAEDAPRSGLSPQQRPSAFPEDDMPNLSNNIGNGNNRGPQRPQNQATVMVEDDAASQFSQDSQDSQDELVELGIPNEDFKSVFIKNAMDKFSNSQLLKARHSLRTLKSAERNNRWTKWALTCPYAVTILRDLFDV